MTVRAEDFYFSFWDMEDMSKIFSMYPNLKPGNGKRKIIISLERLRSGKSKPRRAEKKP